MAQHHIITTGISILTNWMNAQTPRASLEDATRKHKQVEEFFQRDPKAASAEINSLHARCGFPDPVGEDGIGVTLIITTTNEGKQVGSFLENYFKSMCLRNTHKIEVRGLNKPAGDATREWAQQNVTEALVEMRSAVASHVDKLKEQNPDLQVELNCTGGYKAETAILYELGKAKGLPVYYLHETFKTCVSLP